MGTPGLIEFVKENVPILDVALQFGIEIKKQSGNYAYALCPFCGTEKHVKERAWKLQFYIGSNSFSCHRCKIGGSVLDFVMNVVPCDFVQALETLCRIAGRELPQKDKDFYDTNKDIWQIPSVYRYVLNICSSDILKYSYDGKEYTPGEMARIYLRRRGITNDGMIAANELVYVNLRKESLSVQLAGSNFSQRAVTLSGVLDIPEMFYRDSILIPIKSFQKVRQFVSLSCGLLYDRRDPKQMNMVNTEGWAPRRIWGLDYLYDNSPKSVYICESVTDALCINQEFLDKRTEFPAIALGGQHISEVQRDELLKFPQTKFLVTFDKGIKEEESILGKKLAESFGKWGLPIEIPVITPQDIKDPKDVNDLYQLLEDSKSVKIQYRGLTFSEMLTKATREAIDKATTPPKDLSISQLLFAENMNQRVRVKCLPFSEVISTHSIPISVRATCEMARMCENKNKGNCILAKLGKRGKIIDIELDNREIIKFCHTKKEKEITQFWMSELRVPCKAAGVEIKVEKMASVHQIELGPNLDYLTGFEEQSRFTIVRAYLVMPESEDVPKMQPIEVEGRLVSHPIDDHEVILLVTKFERLKDAIEEFVVTDDVKVSLDKFKKMSTEEILIDLAHHTGIADSPDMHLAYILTMHSALHYRLLGADYLGCLHTLVLTDSSTGKSTLGERLIELVRLGEKLSCETAGRTGVTYTLIQSSGRWVVRWGAMPRNDRGFLILDEFQTFPEFEGQHIKEAMSSGKLKVDRAAKDFTYTRNRIIFAANPKAKFRGGSCQLFAFPYPIQAINTVFGTEAEIRRLNLAVLVRSIDYSTEQLHDEKKIAVHPELAILKAEDWQASVRWAWKRRLNDIIIEDEALSYLLKEAAPRLVEKYKYAEDIPLFTASYTKHSMIKMSIALAALLKSTDESYEKLIVKREHIKEVEEWLDAIYSSPSVKLDLYAGKRKNELYMTDEEFDIIIEEMSEGDVKKNIGQMGAYVSMWVNQEHWSTAMLREAVEIDQRLLKKYNRIALNNMLLTKHGSNLNKTPKMAEFVERFEALLDSDDSFGIKSEDLIAPQIDILNL